MHFTVCARISKIECLRSSVFLVVDIIDSMKEGLGYVCLVLSGPGPGRASWYGEPEPGEAHKRRF